jgi:hypothetical protein
MDSRISRVLQVLKEPENLIIIVGVIVAAILGYLGIRNSSDQQTWAAIIAVLGALAIAQILANHSAVQRDKKVESLSSVLQKIGPSTSPPVRPRTELPPLPTRAQNAKDILIIGRSLAIVLRYTEFLRERLRDGAAIRLVMVDPNNDAVCKAMSPLLETSGEGFIADVQSSMGLVKRIAEAAQRTEQLEVRLTDFVPTLSLVAINSQLLTGHIVVELLPYQVSPLSRPHLLFKASETPSWFAYFRDVAECIWRDASPYEVS